MALYKSTFFTFTFVVVAGTEVAKNKENLVTYDPACPLQYAADKARSPNAASKSLAAELVGRAGAGGLSDSGNIYTESPPISSSSSALRRCQSLLDTATTTTALSWQRQAPAVTSLTHHSTCK